MVYFEKTDFKGTCDVCGNQNKTMYSINPHWENGEADSYCCAKCKNKILKNDAKTDEYQMYEPKKETKLSNFRSPFQPFS